MGPRRQFGREFKLEAVSLVEKRSVSVAQAVRDLDVHENVLRKLGWSVSAEPVAAHCSRFPRVHGRPA
jgi:transposase